MLALYIRNTRYKTVLMTTWAKCGGKLFDNEETIELKKDKARLDWLADSEQMIGNIQLPRECVEGNIDSLRSAIDCAMEIGKYVNDGVRG